MLKRVPTPHQTDARNMLLTVRGQTSCPNISVQCHLRCSQDPEAPVQILQFTITCEEHAVLHVIRRYHMNSNGFVHGHLSQDGLDAIVEQIDKIPSSQLMQPKKRNCSGFVFTSGTETRCHEAAAPPLGPGPRFSATWRHWHHRAAPRPLRGLGPAAAPGSSRLAAAAPGFAIATPSTDTEREGKLQRMGTEREGTPRGGSPAAVAAAPPGRASRPPFAPSALILYNAHKRRSKVFVLHCNRRVVIFIFRSSILW